MSRCATPYGSSVREAQMRFERAARERRETFVSRFSFYSFANQHKR